MARAGGNASLAECRACRRRPVQRQRAARNRRPGRVLDPRPLRASVDKRTIMVGQMYVQHQIPKKKTRPYPIVLIHGGGQTASNFLSTPDGRRGWADDFVANGYAVYVVDQAGRGRSGFVTEAYGATRKPAAEEMMSRFSRTPRRCGRRPDCIRNGRGPAPRAIPPSMHSTPRKSKASATKCSKSRSIATPARSCSTRIGPAILLTHSQAGDRLVGCR